jgi:hypothetical protein
MTRKGHTLIRRGTETTLPELERMLTTAAAGQVKESSRRIGRIRPSRVVAIGAACLAFGGTAVAADLWSPEIGTRIEPGTAEKPATTSNTPVPAETLDSFGVFRQEPTAADRSAEVEATLRGTTLVEGMRLDSVRSVSAGVTGEDTIVFSSAGVRDLAVDGAEEEGICVVRPQFVGGLHPGVGCFRNSVVASGDAWITSIHLPAESSIAYGVVPDGVATVTATFGSAPDRTVAVTDNVWEVSLGGDELSNANGEGSVQSTVWRDADGNVVGGGDGNTYPDGNG